MKLENIVQWLYIHRKGALVTLIISIPVIVVMQFFAQHSFILVSVVGASASEPVVTYGSTPSGTDKIGSTGLILVTRATTSIIVENGEQLKTEVALNLPWYGITGVDVKLDQGRNADKVAFASPYASSTCATYSKRVESLLAYKCSNPPSLLQYQTPANTTWSNKALAANILYPGKIAQPYMGGVIGISVYPQGDESAPQPIVYTSDTGASIPYDMPEGIDESMLAEAQVFTNYTDPTDNRFVFVTFDGTVYLGKPTGVKNGVKYARAEAPKDYTKTQHKTLCRIVGDNAHCYSGSAPRCDSDEPLMRDDTIRTYDFEGNVVASTELKKSLVLSNIYVTNSGDIYGMQGKKLYAFEKSGDSYESKAITQNSDAAAALDTLYYVQKGTVYQVDKDGVSHQVFYSKNVKVKSVYASDGKVFILGSLTSSPNDQVHAYQLRDDTATDSGSRVIDLLPAKSGTLPAVTAQSLVGNRLQLEIAVPYTKRSTSGGIADNTATLNQKKQDVLEALSSLGINTQELEISFIY